MAEDKSNDAATTAKSKDEKKEIPKKFEKLVKEIEQLSVLELSELVGILEDHFGVSAAAPAVAMAAPAAGEAGEAEVEKSEFDIVLKDAGSQKIAVIKAVKEITGLGLGEAKAAVDGAPKTIKEGANKEEAQEAKKKLEEAGATVELA